MLMHITPCVLFLGVIAERVHVALHRLIAARGVRIKAAPRLDGEVGGLLHGLHRAISGRLDNHCSLATDPGDNRGPIFVIMAPARLALLAAPTRSVSQRLLSAA